MRFKTTLSLIDLEADTVYLVRDNWDDNFSFATLYITVYVDELGRQHEIGQVKIGQQGLVASRMVSPGFRSPQFPEEFSTLPHTHFSVGQTPSYYANIKSLGGEFRETYLAAMQDIAYSASARERARPEDVTLRSLLRSVTMSAVTGQFARIANGGVVLTPYTLSFPLGAHTNLESESLTLSFSVEPESSPPTNVHVLVGRNGVGKSTFLRAAREQMLYFNQPANLAGSSNESYIANLIYVSFSAFDEKTPEDPQRPKLISEQFIGLPVEGGEETSHSVNRSELTAALEMCNQGARLDAWLEAVRTLESDPYFELLNLTDRDLHSHPLDPDGIDRILTEYDRMSSGHKVVLLAVSRLVAAVEERTLLLIDEPETHLHPPLLSAFTRTVSQLLVNHNGVGILATHSPVVLQEVPARCVWILTKFGDTTLARRPSIETFGENVGTLTHDIFGLEASASGFHKVLTDATLELGDFAAVLARFNNQIGLEGRSLVQAILFTMETDHVER